mmetsp:Transcript_5991/g.14587  ORF Transcript_5991/g.14587 Transcript_5991/m.14587 type:complete len:103 (-) Transcript_5991:220-528(-)
MVAQEDPPHVPASTRRKCWAARDEYFKCVDDALGRMEAGDKTASATTECRALKEEFKDACPAAWAKHFILKRVNEKRVSKTMEHQMKQYESQHPGEAPDSGR